MKRFAVCLFLIMVLLFTVAEASTKISINEKNGTRLEYDSTFQGYPISISINSDQDVDYSVSLQNLATGNVDYETSSQHSEGYGYHYLIIPVNKITAEDSYTLTVTADNKKASIKLSFVKTEAAASTLRIAKPGDGELLPDDISSIEIDLQGMQPGIDAALQIRSLSSGETVFQQRIDGSHLSDTIGGARVVYQIPARALPKGDRYRITLSQDSLSASSEFMFGEIGAESDPVDTEDAVDDDPQPESESEIPTDSDISSNEDQTPQETAFNNDWIVAFRSILTPTLLEGTRLQIYLPAGYEQVPVDQEDWLFQFIKQDGSHVIRVNIIKDVTLDEAIQSFPSFFEYWPATFNGINGAFCALRDRETHGVLLYALLDTEDNQIIETCEVYQDSDEQELTSMFFLRPEDTEATDQKDSDSQPEAEAETEAVSEVHTGVCTGNRVNVRVTPSQNGRSIGQLNKGDSLSVLESEGEWSKITCSKGEGWIKTQYIKLQ